MTVLCMYIVVLKIWHYRLRPHIILKIEVFRQFGRLKNSCPRQEYHVCNIYIYIYVCMCVCVCLSKNCSHFLFCVVRNPQCTFSHDRTHFSQYFW
jgi:hypothetical protein